MPTLIDELVVQLGLDTSKFDQGRRQVDRSLKDLNRTAEIGSKNIQQSVGRTALTVVAFLEAIGRPAQAVEQHLRKIVEPARTAHKQVADLGASSRRTGAEWEAGGLSAAAGFTALAGAALIAFAAVKALNAVMKEIGAQADKTFGVGLGAAAAGIPVQRFSQISQALLLAGNAPESQTQQALVAQQQFLENWARGVPDTGRITALARLGINPRSSPEQLFTALATRFAGESTAKATADAASLNLPETLALGLRSLGANFTGAVNAQKGTAVTERQLKAATDLEKASNQLAISWEAFTRDLETGAEPALATILRGLASFIDMLDKLGPLITSLGDADTNDLFTLLKALADLIGGHPLNALSDLSKLSDLNRGGAATPGKQGTIIPNRPLARATPEIQEAANEIRAGESRGGDYQATNPLSSASGAYQFLDSTWREVAKAIGAERYARAKDAPPDIQDEAFVYEYLRHGIAPWAKSNAARMARGLPSYPQPPGFGRQSLLSPAASAPVHLAMLRSSQAGAHITSHGPTSNDNSTTATIGNITVNTRATDAKGTAVAVRDTLRNTLFAAKANTGMVA